MKEVEFVPIGNVIVGDRARKQFSVEGIANLTNDIKSNEIGLIHPILIKENGELITGERRYKVIKGIHEDGDEIKFAGTPIPRGTIPAIRVRGDFDIIEYLIAEAVENNSREAFSWQERVALDKRIATLQQLKIDAERAKAAPTITAAVVDLLEETGEESEDEKYIAPANRASGAINHLLGLQTNSEKIKISKEALVNASKEVHGSNTTHQDVSRMQASIRLAEALENPEIAEKLRKAPTLKEATKLLKVEEKRIQQEKAAVAQGRELRSADRHTVINGDCLEELAKLKTASVDLCLTDPIYGINAHKFGVAKRDTGFHTYEDTPEEFERILPLAIKEVTRILKPAAHLYLFCDLSKFYQLKAWVEAASPKDNPWTVQSFPLHWIKTNGARCPHPGFTYRKTVEYILFAYRGGKESNHQFDSHFEVSTKRTEIHGAAKDPSGLKVLLNNSAFQNNLVLDFMAGSGSLAIAAHELKMRTIMIESDRSAYGRCVERVKELTEI